MELSIRRRTTIFAAKKGYRVDSDGNVISYTGHKRKVKRDRDNRAHFSVKPPFADYYVTVRVSVLAAYQEFGDAVFEPGNVVRHLDGDPTNDRTENLALGTQSDNMMDRPREERLRHGRMAGRANSHLTDSDIREMRAGFADGKPLSWAMKKYRIAKSTASHIKNRKTYAYL